MKDKLLALLPSLREEASTLDAEYRAAEHRMNKARREYEEARDRSAQADALLRATEEFITGNMWEVPL